MKKDEDEFDEDDFFGDGGDDSAPVVKLEAKPKKKAPVAKSLVLLDVKGWDETADLDALAKKIFAIEKDGLWWKTEYKLEPVAFGIKKLVIGMTIEDEKVSVDEDIIALLESWEDDVQSVDIAVFNKV